MRAIFMGTPDFSVPVLRAMIDHGIEVVGVVTQPDRPKGRGKGVVFSPVKEEALKHGLTILQPEKVRTPDAVEALRALQADVIVVVAFGQILTKDVLEMTPMGCINVHASLLPAYRGAAPIQYAVLDGLEETGVTTMYMNEGLDTGDILLQKRIPLAPDETGGSLFDKLSVIGAEALIETLDRLERGALTPVPQEGESNYVGMIRKSMGQIRWDDSARKIDRVVRGMNPWPSAYTYRDGRMLKIWRVQPVEAMDDPGNEAAPGTVTGVNREYFTVQAGTGSVRILELQPEGKKRMTASEYMRGYAIAPGTVLGGQPE